MYREYFTDIMHHANKSNNYAHIIYCTMMKFSPSSPAYHYKKKLLLLYCCGTD